MCCLWWYLPDTLGEVGEISRLWKPLQCSCTHLIMITQQKHFQRTTTCWDYGPDNQIIFFIWSVCSNLKGKMEKNALICGLKGIFLFVMWNTLTFQNRAWSSWKTWHPKSASKAILRHKRSWLMLCSSHLYSLNQFSMLVEDFLIVEYIGSLEVAYKSIPKAKYNLFINK